VISFFAQDHCCFIIKNGGFFVFLCSFYFLAFNILEASLPSLVSQYADIRSKGTAWVFLFELSILRYFFGGLIAGLLLRTGELKYFFYEYLIVFALDFCCFAKKIGLALKKNSVNVF